MCTFSIPSFSSWTNPRNIKRQNRYNDLAGGKVCTVLIIFLESHICHSCTLIFKITAYNGFIQTGLALGHPVRFGG